VLGCLAGTPVACGDSVACTVDSCNELTDTCDNATNDGLCDNGVFCDGAETCSASVGCQVGASPCGALVCDEPNDICIECFTAVDCTDDGNPCTDTQCSGGTCLNLPNTDLCNDGIACTQGDQCSAGSCAGSADNALCDNGVFCDGAETCDPLIGCRVGAEPCLNPAECDDGQDICLDSSMVVLNVDFDTDESGFSYLDDAFRGTNAPAYASGSYQPAGGFNGGGLGVVLGGVDDVSITGMSGGWQSFFTVAAATQLELRVRYNLILGSEYETDEFGQVMVTVGGAAFGSGGNDYVAQLVGDGNGGADQTTGWQLFSADLGTLAPGTYSVTIGGYNNKKNVSDEITTVLIDDVRVATPEPPSSEQLRIEAENFDAISTSTADSAEWLVVPDEVGSADDVYTNASGACNSDSVARYLRALPDAGANHRSDPFGTGPVVSYAFTVPANATYRIWVRSSATSGSSDSFYLRVRETAGSSWWRFNPPASGGDFANQWQGSGAFGTCTGSNTSSCGGAVPMTETLAAGTYTLDVAMREDGSGLDAIVLDSLGTFTGSDAEAALVPCAGP
jgi:hypothetical protein